MQRYFFEICYNGSSFHGWQRQPNATSVQQVIEDIFSKLHSGKEITIVGCGRTDAGVHAKKYFFHVDLPEIADLEYLVFKLNRMFPKGIAVFNIIKVKKDIHARFDAKNRTYRYFIHQQKDPFKEELSLYFPQELNFEAMNEAAKLLLGKKDFGSFSKLHTDVKTNICEVFSAEWIISKQETYFEISANRFLRNMVRAIVGTLIDVGMEKLANDDIISILEAKDRQEASLSVPAHGLYLWDIEYDF
ncbi:MAG: tRNA pseudouridine(38-40) synthase TruA [Bacteroidetes bacterium]|nr:tRNA pseudouridine(38-40) synthase TruA [Bacteroidota bacterium]